MPNTIKKIGEDAFLGCTSLEEIHIPPNIESIGLHAFKNCASLKQIVVDGDTCFESEYDSDNWDFPYQIWDIPTECTIIASDEWKRKNYHKFPRHLEAYKPDPQTKDIPPQEPIEQSPNPTEKKGCYIATAVYGSYDCPEVWTLRRFRDEYLSQSVCGRAFIRCYYATSPTLVRWFGKTAWFNRIWRNRLNRLIERLHKKGYEDTPYNDK